MRVPNLLGLLSFVVLLVACSTATAQNAGLTVTPAELQWKTGRVAGLERANLVGEPGKPGPAIFRLKFPPGYTVQAHSFPDDRTYTVLSGSWYLGWGTKFDDAKLKPLPAGSFYAIPANVPHFVATKADPVIVQVTGTEPSGVRYVDPSHAPKK
jgi:quercetin dioxygenase-like cupin family protein